MANSSPFRNVLLGTDGAQINTDKYELNHRGTEGTEANQFFVFSLCLCASVVLSFFSYLRLICAPSVAKIIESDEGAEDS